MKKLEDATCEDLFNELNKCKIAKILLSKASYKKQWQKYENAIQQEIKLRSDEFEQLSNDELLDELFA